MKKIIFILFTVSVLFGPSVIAEAAAEFSIQPNIPENQKSNQSFFDLQLEIAGKQTISIDVFNESDETIRVVPEFSRASTADTGTIDYQSNSETDNSVSVDIEDIVKGKEKVIEIGPKDKATVHWDIQMPEEEFQGILLGGFRFTLEDSEEGTTGIQNRFAYTVGMILSNKEVEQPINLNLLDIQPGHVNYRNHILVTLQNDQARLIDKLKVQAEVFPEGKAEAIYSAEKQEMRMAPNSSFDFGISTNEAALKPGAYRLVMTAEADGEQFSWEENFEISRNQSKSLNSDAILQQDTGLEPWVWVLIGAVGVFGLLVLVGFYRKKKRV